MGAGHQKDQDMIIGIEFSTLVFNLHRLSLSPKANGVITHAYVNKTYISLLSYGVPEHLGWSYQGGGRWNVWRRHGNSVPLCPMPVLCIASI
jgi:hypothetical protein